MGKQRSKCRNCDCLHYYLGMYVSFPIKCYCIKQNETKMANWKDNVTECFNYEPSDNLEYMEWQYEKRGNE